MTEQSHSWHTSNHMADYLYLTTSIPSMGKRFFSTSVSRLALGLNKPPIQHAMETHPLGAKQPQREADHSPPFRAEVKNEFFQISSMHTAKLIKQQDSFTIYAQQNGSNSCLSNTRVLKFLNMGLRDRFNVKTMTTNCCCSLVKYWPPRLLCM
jgi:hypothetical protein